MPKRYSSKEGFLKLTFWLSILLVQLKTLLSDFIYEVEILNVESINSGEIESKEMCKERGLYFDRFTYANRSTVCISTIEGFECSIIILPDRIQAISDLDFPV